MKKCLLLLSGVLLTWGQSLTAQVRPLHSWEISPSYRGIRHIAGGDGLIFAASANGLFSYREGQAVNPITKTDGLSDQAIGAMIYLEGIQSLLIGYTSGIVDMVRPDGISSDQSLLKLDDRLPKAIHHIATRGNQAFLASDLGIIEYRTDLRVVRDLYRNIGEGASPVSCYQVIIRGDSLFAFCDQGMFRGNINANLLDFTQWDRLMSTAFDESTRTILHDDTLYVSAGTGEVLRFDTDGLALDTLDVLLPVGELITVQGAVYVAAGNTIRRLAGTTSQLLQAREEEVLSLYHDGDRFWVGEQGKGLTDLDGTTVLLPDGPHTDRPDRLRAAGESIYLFDGLNRYSVYRSGTWQVIETPADIFVDVVTFLGEEWLLEQEGRLVAASGTELQIAGLSGRLNGAVVFDDRIWVTLSDSNSPLMSSPDLEDWTAFPSSDFGTSSLSRPQVSVGGTFYFFDRQDNIVAFEPGIGQVRLINRADGLPDLPTDLIIDARDRLYVATGKGLFYYPDATFIFNSDPLTEAFIGGGDLLSVDPFFGLAVDAGDRKWLATDQGIWHYDDDLNEPLAHYNASGSPLPSDRGNRLVYQPSTGLLWALSPKGIVSLQTDSREGQFFYDNVKIYPNPVSIRNGTATVGISGLYANTLIKITTLSGRYVNEVRANGSLASWNLRTRDGQPVGPGIYLFFSSGEEGRNTYVGKLLIKP